METTYVGFGLLEYSILALYLIASVAIGLYFARSQKNIEGYYLAERAAPWWAVAISIISSDTTAISYIGCAAFVFTNDLQYSLGSFTVPFAALLVAYIFVPFMARLRLFTIYEYLEHRFNVSVRTVASLLFMLQRSAHLSVAMYAGALALSQVMGIHIIVGLIILGGLTTLYTVFGGMKAVLWTDVIQFFVLTGGVIAILVAVAMAFNWDIAQIWNIAAHPPQTIMPWHQPGQVPGESHTKLFNFQLDPTIEVTFWAIMIYSFLYVVSSYGSDQVLVQRYLAAGSKKEMAKSLIFSSIISIPSAIALYLTGIGCVAYYNFFINKPGHEWVSSLTDANRVLPHFITHALPGVLGAVVIAGLFAGTMSSFSAGLNSLSTATYIDFMTRFGKKKEIDARALVRTAKLVTAAWGIAIIFAAMFFGGKDTIFKLVAKVMGLFGGPLIGMFFLGIFTRRTNSLGVIFGAVTGVISTALAANFTALSWLYYAPFGCVVAMIVGYFVSFFAKAPELEKIRGLVVGTLSEGPVKPEVTTNAP